MRVFMLLVLIAAMVFLSACGSNDSSDYGLRVAIVTSLSGVDDRSFNQNNYEGIRSFIAANPGSTVQHIHETTGTPEAAVQYVERIVGDFDVIVMPGFQFNGIGRIAVNNPYTNFILVDAWPAAFDGESEFPNVRALQFAEQESGFLSGVVAAMESRTERVAFVGGYAFPPVVNYQFGFESGVSFANATLGTTVTVVEIPHRYGVDVRGINVGGNYVGSFADSGTGYEIANELLAEGVDIIFVAAGGAGSGVHSAVMAYSGDARLIGIDTDQFETARPDERNILITAAYKAMGLNVHRSLDSLVRGDFVGGNHIMRTDTNSVGIVTAPGQHQMAVETANRINELFGKLRDGTIVPASNFNGHTPDNFPGLQ